MRPAFTCLKESRQLCSGAFLRQVKFIFIPRRHLSGLGLTGFIYDDTTLFSQLTSLRIIDISSNGVSGSLPASLDVIGASLANLTLAHNQIVGTIPPYQSLMVLQNLDISNNDISGPFPTNWVQDANGDGFPDNLPLLQDL